MGMIDRFLGVGQAAGAIGGAAANVAEIFNVNVTRQMELDHAAYASAVAQLQSEFAEGGSTWFDSFVNGLNRLPRPALALGTLGMFVYAMVEPVGFSARMSGLALVPEPMWWLLGAIVSFYFGAREAHHFRRTRVVPPPQLENVAERTPISGENATEFADNAALRDWAKWRENR